MVDFIDNVQNAVMQAYAGTAYAGSAAKRGVLFVGEGTSRFMYDIYSLEGFEKWTKALGANLRALSLFPRMRGVFDECIKTLEAQKDLYYATLFIGSINDFISEPDKLTGKRSFKLPRIPDNDPNGKIDYIKILYAVGNFFDTGKFLQKYKVFSFENCTRAANFLGSVQVFNLSLKGQPITLGDIPVVKALFDKPKDAFIFLASCIEVKNCVEKLSQKGWNLEVCLKLVGSIGKITLISTGDILYKRSRVVLAIIDVTTQNASLIAFFLKKQRERVHRFEHPKPFVVAA